MTWTQIRADSRRFTLILVSLSALIRVPFELVAETTINADNFTGSYVDLYKLLYNLNRI